MHIAEIHYKPLFTLYTKSYSMQWDVGRDSCHDQDIKNASMSTQSLRKQSMHWKEVYKMMLAWSQGSQYS